MTIPNSHKDPFWSNLASATESQLELPKGLLQSVLLHGERSNNNQVSEAGAKTPFQIIPATRKAALDKYGIDAYLSPENAAEVAGRLLKDSLDRNKGDVASAVAEYHGGTDRSNWGAKTKSYVDRTVSGFNAIKVKSLGDDFAAWMKANPAVPQQPSQQPATSNDAFANDFAAWMKNQNGGAVAQIPGAENVKPVEQTPEPSIGERIVGAAEGAANLGTALTSGAVGLGIGTVAGIGNSIADGTFGTPAGVQQAEATAQRWANAGTYEPRTEVGKQTAGMIGEGMQQLTPIVGIPGEVAAVAGTVKPTTQAVRQAMPSAVQAVESVRRIGQEGAAAVTGAAQDLGQRLGIDQPAETPPAAAGASVGAAGANPVEMARATVANSTPELKASVEQAIAQGEPLHMPAIENQAAADNLPIPIRLTQAEALEDPLLITKERNERGMHPEYTNRIDETNTALRDNLQQIKEQAAPDVFAQTKTEHGEQLIKQYEDLDDALRADIREKYKALEDANGGSFPIDTQAFVNSAEANLARKNRNHFLPGEVRSLLNQYKDGLAMTFNDFEELRTILASEARKADRAGDGNKAMAVSAVRQALEDLPLSTDATNMKALADAARTAAKNRFDMLKADPAFKSVVDGTAMPDNFFNKHVVLADTVRLQTMLRHLGQDARQVMASGLVNWLRDAAKVTVDSGTFAQASFNKALSNIQAKLVVAFEPQQAMYLENLGRTARLAKQQVAGSSVNNSGTALELMRQGAKGAMETAVNAVTPGVKLGTKIAKFSEHQKAKKEVAAALRVGAGISAKESKLLEVRRKVKEVEAKKKAKQQRQNP